MINLTDRERELVDQICVKKKTGSAQKLQNDQGSDKKLSNQSNKILITKLERKLNETLADVDLDKSGSISYQQLGRVFTLLEIFQATQYNNDFELELQGYQNAMQKQSEIALHDKAWLILANEQETVDIQAVFCFFRIILDPNSLDASKCALLIKEYISKFQNAIPNQEAIMEFCRDFHNFQKSRLSAAKIGYLKPNLAQDLIQLYEKTLTFKPALNPISEALSISHKKDDQDQSRVDELYKQLKQRYRKQEIYKQKVDILKQEKMNKEMEECTFKPKIISKKELPSVVDRLYQVKDRRYLEERAQQAELERQEQEYSKCSFHPQIIDCPEQSYTDIKGFDRTVQRVRSALDKKHLREIQLNHKPSGEHYLQNKEQPFKPPEMLNRPQLKKEPPILTIDVKISQNKVGRLAIRRGDVVEKVVESFAKVWGIEQQQQHESLLAQVVEHMSKIEQELTQESDI